ncbi:MAG: IS200/IS605 family transposase [Spirulinaceae cyanobacterium]
MATELRKGRHSVTDLKIHLVCVTKYRKGVFTSEGLSCIEGSFQTVAQKMGFRVLEFHGETDRVHVVIEYPPKLSVSQIVNHLKGVSSRMYKKAGHASPHPTHLWSPSYFASSVGGASIEVLRQYIETQQKPS